MAIIYAYPMWHRVSFTVIAEKHVEWVKKLGLAEVYEVDELGITSMYPILKYTLVLHPAFFIMHRILQTRVDRNGRFREDYYSWWRDLWDGLIGVDVCDSDAYTQYAVEIASRFDKFIVPSNFCVEVARKSGVKAKVYRLPHGADPEWYTTPNVWEVAPVKAVNPSLVEAYLYKIKKGRKFLLFWLWHSADRKGFPELVQLYTKLVRVRKDVMLLLKTMTPNSDAFQVLAPYGVINIYGWLDEYEKMALYDLADVNLMFSRGGGWEMNCFESLVRGVPCIAPDWGSWKDYVPEFLTVRTGLKVQPLPNNAIHGGYGYTVDVEDALNKVNDVLDNYEEYKARTEEWRVRLSKEFRWDLIARKLVDFIND